MHMLKSNTMKRMDLMRRLPVALFLGLFIFAATVVSGCDSNEEDTIDTSALIGSYEFTQFVFRPNADPSILAPANVLDTLVAGQTSLRFSANNRFLLEYRFQGAASDLLFIEGTYEIIGDEVRLRTSGSFDNERNRLLLPGEFRLTALDEGARLEGNINLSGVTMSFFSPRYNGIGKVNGALQLNLTKRT